MSPRDQSLVIVAHSARALAESAARGGWRPIVVDAFGDTDTRRVASRYVALPLVDGKVDVDRLGSLVADLVPVHKRCGLVYGACLAAAPALLERLAAGRTLYGNAAPVVRAVREPRRFFRVLDRLGIDHPAVRFTSPPRRAGWLVKNALGEGGAHVRFDAAGDRWSDTDYWQQFVPGPPMSVTFLADGERAQILGVNTLFVDAVPHAPFRYGGAMNHAALGAAARRRIEDAIARLVVAFELRGLNGLDFIAGENGPQVLEINPRPPASFELYEPAVRSGLLSLHLRASRGRLPGVVPPKPRRIHAYRVVYARAELTVGGGLRWPAWCRDIPGPGTWIDRGMPLCTVHAHGYEPEAVLRALDQRVANVVTGFYGAERRA